MIRQKIKENFANRKEGETDTFVAPIQENLTSEQLMEMFGESMENSNVNTHSPFQNEEGDAHIKEDSPSDYGQSISHSFGLMNKTNKKFPSVNMDDNSVNFMNQSTVKPGNLNMLQSQVFMRAPSPDMRPDSFSPGENAQKQIDRLLSVDYSKNGAGKAYPVSNRVDDLIKTVQKDVGKRLHQKMN